MKFNAIVGNPPYQVMDGGGASTSAISVYNFFVEIAKLLNTKYISMIIPARWFAGGKGLDLFREKNLKDRHYRIIFDYPNPKDCFPTANISGGVCYFLYDKDYNGNCTFTNVIAGKQEIALRKLDEFDVFIRYNNAITIVHKVTNATSSFLIDIVSARNPFGIDSSVRGKNQKSNNTHLTLYSSKGIGYISENGIKDAFQLVNSYKIFMGKVLSGHLGETDENGQVKVISSIIEAKPQEISTDSYLAFGPFNDKNCVANLHKYLRTKFLRFLLLQALTSMNISRGNFRFVPLQNFTNESDIDWYKSVEDIDYQLYTKYHLINEEITFIEKMIKPM